MMGFTFFLAAYAVNWFAGIDSVHAIFEEHPCATGQFKVIGKNAEVFIRCQTCYMCPPGYGVHQECTETSDTICRTCPNGYFSDSSTRRGGCQKCRPCLDEADTIRECTPNSNRECREKCSLGDYLDMENRRCMPCSLCHQERNVRVTRNEQCQSQGLPEEWVCSSNITITDGQGNTINTFETGDTYSFKDVSRRRHEGGPRNTNMIPPLGRFIRQHSEPRTDSGTSTSSTFKETTSARSPVSEEAATSREVLLQNEISLGFNSVSTHRPDEGARHATESFEHVFCDGKGNAIIYWVVTLTYILLIVVIAALAIILCDYHRYYKLNNINRGHSTGGLKPPSQKCVQCVDQPWSVYHAPPPYSQQDFPSNIRPLVCIGGLETGV